MCKVQTSALHKVDDQPTKSTNGGDNSGLLLGWLIYESPTAAKHHNFFHPLIYMTIHYTVVIALAFGVHDWMVLIFDEQDFINNNNNSPSCRSFQLSIAKFLCCYCIWFLPWRLYFCPASHPRTSIIYENAWLCNVTLWLSALALLTNRPLICIACCVTVGIDQLLWYVDLLGFVTIQKFPIGVARYLTWPETSWATRITCTHHVWTIPLLLTATGGQVPFLALPFSFILMIANVCLSRMMVPPSLCHTDTAKKDHIQNKYLNVNLSHELWRDIKIKLIQINYDDPPAPLYLFRLLWRWQGFNTIAYYALVLLCKLIFHGDNHICKPIA